MSTISERQQNLIRAMQAQNFETFFDGDKDDAYDTIVSSMQSFVDYQNHVINMSIVLPTIHARYDGQDLRDKIMDLDSTRKIKHDNAIANMSMLNRICDAYGVEPIAPVDTNDRYQVADFVGEFCTEIYEENKSGAHLTVAQHGKIVDNHVKAREGYNTDTIRNRINELDAKFGNIPTVSGGDTEYEV